MEQLLIRSATEKDFESILAIYNDVVLTSTATFEEEPRPLSEFITNFQSRLKLGYPTLVADVNGQVVGYGTYARFRGASGYRPTVEHSLHVHSDFRGRGIGSKILRQLIESAHDLKLHSMIAGIDASNSGSIKLHENFGFQKVAHIPQVARKFDRWLDLDFMQLILSK